MQTIDPKELPAAKLYELRDTLNKRTALYRAVKAELIKREKKANTRFTRSASV